MRRAWKVFRLAIVFPLISLLPMPLAYRLGALAYRFDPALRRPARAAAAHGMRRLLPEAGDPHALRKLLDAQQDMLGRELLDTYMFRRLSKRNIARLVAIEGLENLVAPHDDGRGCLLAFAHYGRPSLAFVALSLAGAKIHVVTQAIGRSNPGLDAIDRAFLGFKVRQNLRHLTGGWIPLSGRLRPVYDALAKGETVVMLFDVCPSAGSTVDTPFFGARLRLPQGVARILGKTGARLCFAGMRDEGWRARLCIAGVDNEDPDAAFGAAVARLEADVRSAPHHWWQWGILDHLMPPAEGRP